MEYSLILNSGIPKARLQCYCSNYLSLSCSFPRHHVLLYLYLHLYLPVFIFVHIHTHTCIHIHTHKILFYYTYSLWVILSILWNGLITNMINVYYFWIITKGPTHTHADTVMLFLQLCQYIFLFCNIFSIIVPWLLILIMLSVNC